MLLLELGGVVEVGGADGGKVAVVGVVGALAELHAAEQFGDDEVEIRVTLAVGVGGKLIGTSSMEAEKSVPWSRLIPRRKYWFALPCRVTVIPTPAARAVSAIMATHCSRSPRRLKGAERSSIVPASILEKSSTSSTSVARSVAQLLIESRIWRWRPSSFVS